MNTLNDLLLQRVAAQGAAPAARFLHTGEPDGPQDAWTYADLGARSQAVAAALQDRCAPGDRALLVYPPGLDFVAGFVGCLLAGVVAVPAYPPDPSRFAASLIPLNHILADSAPTVVLTTSLVAGLADAFGDAVGPLRELPWLATDTLPADAGSGWRQPEVGPQDIAFLQYTSGSTRRPAGVMVRHANLLANLNQVCTAARLSAEASFCSWLPMFHDMGLIGSIICPVYLGSHTVLMSPVSFLRNPLCWLRSISAFRSFATCAPNFAFELCLRRATDADVAGLDLSCWGSSLNGAERVRPETLARFAARFAPAGLSAHAMFPAYGLAEATVFVSGGHVSDELALVDGPSAGQLVPCGAPGEGMEVVVVDPKRCAVGSDGAFGELWVRGPNVAAGYWGAPERTAATFGAYTAAGDGPFLRTGDLGTLVGGQVYVGGRLKDLVIVRGRNLCPEDLEHSAAQSHPGVRPGCVVALGVELDGEEQLVVLVERNKRHDAPPEEVVSAVRAAIARDHQVQARGVVVLEAGALPKTSSGKLQRRRAGALLEAGQLAERHRSFLDKLDDVALEAQDAASIERWLVASLTRVRGHAVDADTPFAELGVDSLQATELAAALERALGRPVPVTEVFDHPTARRLAEHVARGEAPVPTAPAGGGIWDLLDQVER
jgi:acyl-CoA synthetase (AMP-forming)/AMP-acid ligase II/acyl carrier protein